MSRKRRSASSARVAAILEHAADDTVERMEAKLELRGDPEVPATASEPPEQLGVLVPARTDEGPVRSHELGADEVVARQAVLRGQVTDPATESQAGNARGAHDAAGRDEADCLRRRVEVEPGGAAGGAGDPCLGVHVDVPHRREVDHEAVVADAMPSGIMPTTANRDLQPVRTGKIEGGGHVLAPAHRTITAGRRSTNALKPRAPRRSRVAGAMTEPERDRCEVAQALLDTRAHADVTTSKRRCVTEGDSMTRVDSSRTSESTCSSSRVPPPSRTGVR